MSGTLSRCLERPPYRTYGCKRTPATARDCRRGAARRERRIIRQTSSRYFCRSEGRAPGERACLSKSGSPLSKNLVPVTIRLLEIITCG